MSDKFNIKIGEEYFLYSDIAQENILCGRGAYGGGKDVASYCTIVFDKKDDKRVINKDIKSKIEKMKGDESVTVISSDLGLIDNQFKIKNIKIEGETDFVIKIRCKYTSENFKNVLIDSFVGWCLTQKHEAKKMTEKMMSLLYEDVDDKKVFKSWRKKILSKYGEHDDIIKFNESLSFVRDHCNVIGHPEEIKIDNFVVYDKRFGDAERNKIASHMNVLENILGKYTLANYDRTQIENILTLGGTTNRRRVIDRTKYTVDDLV